MRGVRLDQLALQLTRPLLYCHHGHCEHTLHLADVRLLHSGTPHTKSGSGRNHGLDVRQPAAYPRCTFRSRVRMRSCDVCELSRAEFVVYGDRLAPSLVSFLCLGCHHRLHYTVDGVLLDEDLTVFPYLQDA